MDRAEILDGLRAMLSNVSTEADDFDEHARMDRGVLREAIALLTPEPVTEEGLRAEGFRRSTHITKGFFFLGLPDGVELIGRPGDSHWLLETDAACVAFNITTMNRLREVIKALRGNESEASE